MKTAAIIGGGISGLATAALLAKHGYSVTLYEKNEMVGGRAMIFKQDGFTFDMGPSWYHMPEVFERYFNLFDKKPTDFYDLIKLDPQYKVFFSPNDCIEIEGNLEKNLELFERIEKGAKDTMKNYLSACKIQYEAANKAILYKNFDTWADIFQTDLIKEAKKMYVFKNLEDHLNTYFKSKKIKNILKIPVVFIGQNPKTAPAFLSLFSHIDLTIGVHYPMHGIYAFIDALVTLCKLYNVTIKCNEEVKKITCTKSKATTIVTNQGEFPVDTVVSGADYAHTETNLLDKEYQSYPSSYWESKEIAPSAFIMYLGVNKKIPHLFHHNYIIPADLDTQLSEQFKGNSLPNDPLIYISCPSKTDNSVAPANSENIFVTIAIPTTIELSNELKRTYADNIIAKIEEYTQTKFKEDIVVEKIFTIDDFKTTFNAWRGTSIGLSQSLMQSAILRPHHRSSKVKNIYFTGQYTHPGIGMPMCLISAELVVNLIINDR